MATSKLAVLRNILFIIAAMVVLIVAFFSWCYSGAVGSIETQEKVIALTFDDGPNPPHTEALLDVLARHNVKATFFLKGQNVDAFPQLVPVIAAAGHEIGNHSYHHRPMGSFSKEEMGAEVRRVNAQLKALLGTEPELFRPPFGVQGPGLKLALAELGMTSVLANASGLDWELTDGEEIANKVLADAAPGGILLLHDGHGDIDQPHEQDSRAASVAATELIITRLGAQGYRFVTAGELLAMR